MGKPNKVLLILLWQFLLARDVRAVPKPQESAGEDGPQTEGTTQFATTEEEFLTTSNSESAFVCEYLSTNYEGNATIMQDDCYEYVCQDGEWSKTGETDPKCCFDYNLMYYGDKESEYIALNGTSFSYDCRTVVCTSRDNLITTEEIYPGCCLDNGTRTMPGSSRYLSDCYYYTCNEGTWIKTNETSPRCCANPDLEGHVDYYYEYNDDLTVRELRNSDGENPKQWHALGEKRTQVDCQEVICVSRNQWDLTGNVTSNCTAGKECTFNGKTYQNFDRLPGCMKVYCINGYWLQNGYIDPRPMCSKCYARSDPHFNTFDGYSYDYMEFGNYTLTQEGKTFNPSYGVSNDFEYCGWTGPTCVGPSIFKDSPHTIIQMGGPQLYKLLVNGVEYEIPNDNIPRLVKEGSEEHAVFAWRYNGCIRLLGSSKLSVQQCGYSVDIWAPNELYDSLYGLCGLFDGNITNDFTSRDEIEFPLQSNPGANGFTLSWFSIEITPGRKRRDADVVEEGTCTLNSTTEADLLAMCNEVVGAAGNGMTQEERDISISECLFDLCSISSNTSGDQGAINQWLANVKSIVEVTNDVAKKTTEDDVLPEPLPEEPSTSTTDMTEGPDEGPPNSEHHFGKLIVQVHQNVG